MILVDSDRGRVDPTAVRGYPTFEHAALLQHWLATQVGGPEPFSAGATQEHLLFPLPGPAFFS